MSSSFPRKNVTPADRKRGGNTGWVPAPLRLAGMTQATAEYLNTLLNESAFTTLLTAHRLNARYAAPKIPAWLPRLDFKISLGSLRQT